MLLVGDGPYMDTDPARFGISFPTDGEGNYTQDLSDNTFTVSELIYLLTTAVRSISVNTAHRRDGAVPLGMRGRLQHQPQRIQRRDRRQPGPGEPHRVDRGPASVRGGGPGAGPSVRTAADRLAGAEVVDEFGEQGGAFGHGGDGYVFVFGVGVAADGAEAVQGGAAGGCGEVAV